MTWRAQIDDHGVVTRYKDLESGKVISAAEYEKQQSSGSQYVSPTTGQALSPYAAPYSGGGVSQQLVPPPPPVTIPLATNGSAPLVITSQPASAQQVSGQFVGGQPTVQAGDDGQNPLIQPGAQILGELPAAQAQTAPVQPLGASPTPVKGKNLRMEGLPHPYIAQPTGFRTHGFLDATSIAILIPTLIILTLIIAAAHKKRLFPWQTLRPFNPPTGLMTPREYERSYLCPPNARRSGKLGKRNVDATWTEEDGTVLPFGFLARTHLPVTIPLGRLPNKNMFIVAPSGSGKTTLMRAIIKAMLARPCVIVALEAKANDPNLDEMKEGFKFTVLPAAQEAGFAPLYFNPLDEASVFWNPLDLDPITFSSSLIPNLNLLDPEEQHWAERDHGYIAGLATLLKWGAVMVSGEDESGIATDVQPLPCNPRGLMRLVNNRRNIVESLRRLKNNPDVDPMELSELSLTLSSIIRTDTDWDKNIQGVRGRLRMFKNPNVLRVTEHSSIDLRRCMFEPTVLIFGAPASLGPDAESLADCFVYQLQQALHMRYGTASVLPLFAFFDEYQTLNLDIAGRLSAIVRGANGGLTVILQNVSQITGTAMMREGTMAGMAELKTIFSNAAIRICLHNADDTTARFFSDEIGKHAVVIPGVSDHFGAGGFATFPTAWNRIHSQQVVSRVDADAIKRMEAFHGLLYLSPAGGAFGEVKPLMVDLRGIEEIARIHLLHSKRPAVTPDGTGTGAGTSGNVGTSSTVPITSAGADSTSATDADSSVPSAPSALGPEAIETPGGSPVVTGGGEEEETTSTTETAAAKTDTVYGLPPTENNLTPPASPRLPGFIGRAGLPQFVAGALTDEALRSVAGATSAAGAASKPAAESTTSKLPIENVASESASESTIQLAGKSTGETKYDVEASEATVPERDVTGAMDGVTPMAEAPDKPGLGGKETEHTSMGNLVTDKEKLDMQEQLDQVAVAAAATQPTTQTASQSITAQPVTQPVSQPTAPPMAQPTAQQPMAQPTSQPTAAPQPGPRRICPFCGNIAGRGKFCISCGKSLDAADVPAATTNPAQSVAPESFQKPRLTGEVVSAYPPSKSNMQGNLVPDAVAKANGTVTPALKMATEPNYPTAATPPVEKTQNAQATSTVPVAPPTSPTSTVPTSTAPAAPTQPAAPPAYPAADAQVNSVGLRRIPPPSMPAVYGIRSHHSLSPRMAPSRVKAEASEEGDVSFAPPNNSTSIEDSSTKFNGSDSNLPETSGITGSTGSDGLSIPLRDLNPSWMKRPPQ